MASGLAIQEYQIFATMVRNYFKTALRSLLRNRAFTVINVLGLVLGISGTIIIYKIISFETSFDQYHTNADRVYRIGIHQENESEIQRAISVQHPLGAALRNDFPDAKISRIDWYYNGVMKVVNDQGVERKLKVSEKTAFVEQEFFEMFDFEVIAGNPQELLVSPNSAVLSASLADKLFDLNGSGYQSIIGKVMRYENKLDLTITGVYADPPENSDYDIDLLMEYQGAKIYPYANGLTSWGTRNGSTRCFIMLPQGQTEALAEQQLREASKKYLGPLGMEDNVYYALQPLSDIHMSEDYGNMGRLDKATIESLKIVALVLVLIAVINFINLATAQSVKRAKEIGIRKVLGSKKHHLVGQFLGEVFLIALLALLISLGISEAALMRLEPFLGYSLSLNILAEPSVLLFLLGLLLVTTLLAGFYPSMVLTSFNPVETIKSNALTAKKGKWMSLRRVLVVFQFLISQTLIIGTLVVVFQRNYMDSQPIGFQSENILTFQIPDRSEEKLSLLKSRLDGITGLEELSFFVATPGASNTNNLDGIKDPRGGEDSDFTANRKDVDQNYGRLFELPLIAGEFYNENSPKDHTVINRKLMNMLGITDPAEAIGQRFETTYDGSYYIAGVVEDFHNNSFRDEISPVFMLNNSYSFFEGGIRLISPSGNASIISQVEKIWSEVFPEDVFEYVFVTDRVEGQYEIEQKVSQLFQVFSSMAIIICCLGLYGLVSFMANQKVKEIGIRKVLGASVSSILMIFSKEVLVLLAIGFVIAAPLTYMVMSNWLNGYVYHISLGAQIFILGLVLTAIVAGLTVGFRALSAATANPIKSLRDE